MDGQGLEVRGMVRRRGAGGETRRDSTGTGEVGANTYASAIGARGGTLERALFKAGKEASGPSRGNQTEEKNDTEEPDEPPEDTEEDDGEGR